MKDKEAKIKIVFKSVEVGLIRYELYVKGKKINFRSVFSHVFDPILDIKEWLENIVHDDEVTTFLVDTEGEEYLFKYDQGKFSLHNTYYSEEKNHQKKIASVKVSRRELVEVFYYGLEDFFLSKMYKKDEWEFEIKKELACEKLQIDERQLENYLLSLNKKQLSCFSSAFSNSYKWDSAYVSSYEKLGFKHDLKSFHKVLDSGAFKKDKYLNLKGYNKMNWFEKTDMFRSVMREKSSSFKGSGMEDFESDIVRNFLMRV